MWIYVWLAKELDVWDKTSKEDLVRVLIHDADEAITGDIPSTNKKRARSFPTNHAQLLRMADLIEAYLFCREEEAFGNTAMGPIMDDIIKRGQVAHDQFEILARTLWLEVHPVKHPGLKACD